MNPIKEILAARGPTMIRISSILDYSNDLSQVLKKFGLTPDRAALVAQDRANAIAILTHLLWKGQAYDYECMDSRKAAELAERIISENESTDSRYFSNRTSALSNSWNGLTDSTFDSGIVVSSEDGQYFCIWLEDED
ncbi:hypothetical protein GXB81_03650 [Paraburkholderia sp. Ac-20336]|uniref:hypothetical protein n=1 Tax=unclassified Paraburkholderia TaxID=2615204 RepID=UPI001421CBEA|nr:MULTISPECIES: hypothetical protein [unclassified Paraburkholderia]MBN3802151.1 hypothetical protein [Paraburkholderia sp. Ac-20336]MBN3848570.1 hypothetical protein [Paraburkholderia sp. Ac-20342]NIF76132.1 hypothetical protein [Paraburkholderia sp. Cy-641]